MAACRIVIGLEIGELAFEVRRVPEQHVIEKLSPDGPDEPFHKGMREWHVGHGLDFVDLEHAERRLPTVGLEQRIMVSTEMPRGAPPPNGAVEHAAEAGAIDSPAVYAESDDAAGELVHHHEHPIALEHDGLTPKQVEPYWMQKETMPAWAAEKKARWEERAAPVREEMLKALEPSKK